MIILACPHCDQHIEADDEMGGMQFDCPSCARAFIVPETPKPVAKSESAVPTPQAQNAPPPPPNYPPVDLEELQKVSNYRLIHKILKPAGIGSIVWGLLGMFVVLGDSGASSITDWLLGLVSLYLLAEGIWILSTPTPYGLILLGIGMLAVGVLNIVYTTLGDSSHWWRILGISQILWGGQNLLRYRRCSRLVANKPSEATLKMIEETVAGVRGAAAANTPDIVKIHVDGFFGPEVWIGRLSQDHAVFMENSGIDVVFLKKSDVQFNKQRKSLVGNQLNASFRLGDRKVKGSISPESYQKYEAWKAATPI